MPKLKTKKKGTSPKPTRPVPWVIKLLTLFNLYTPDEPDDRIKADLCMEVDENGFSAGNFRWALNSSKLITVNFKASDIFWPSLAEDFDLVLVTRAADIKLAHNMTSWYTDKPWTNKPWTDKPWTDKPWTDKPWTRQTLDTTNPGHDKPQTRQTLDTIEVRL
jgi:hypothetical protein